MKLFINLLVFVYNRYLRRKSAGESLKVFASSMGIVYIKFAQILATQNVGNVFTEEDRKALDAICDDVNPIPFREIKKVLKEVYGDNLHKIFSKISRKKIGSASVSQVHRAKLSTGEDVVIKVKRKDVCDRVEHDIRTVRTIVKYFGWAIGLKNQLASGHALTLYFKWIQEEMDFVHEVENIISYKEFADSVNGKVSDTVNIVVPKVYKEYSNNSVIVMEYIPYKPLSKYKEFDEEIRNKVSKAFNSYIRLSFYALLSDKPVIFHGDPHFGNIYLDDKGNIGFLDMGLTFALTKTNTELTKEFFFSAFLGKAEHLYNMLLVYMPTCSEQDRNNFRKDVEVYCKTVHRKVLSAYFMDMVWVCFKYNIDPPEFLFCMGKAFVYLSGADSVFANDVVGYELLKQQVTEFLIENTMTSLRNVVTDSVNTVIASPNGLRGGIISSAAKTILYLSELFKYL